MIRLRSIQVKIISVILIILAVTVFLSITLALSNQKNNLLDAARQTLAINTSVLNHTIRNIMLSGEAPLANRTMADLREMDEFLEYEIYRKDGTLAFSNYETLDFVNEYQDDVMFSRTPRQEGDGFSASGFQDVLKFKTPVVQLDEEAMEMEYYFPILNYADCRSCHGVDHFIRGISHFRISLSDIYAKVASARRFLSLIFLAVGAIIFAWMIIMLRRIIIRPVFAIGGIVSRVGAGDLDASIALRQRDEFGSLAEQINTMIRRLKESKLLELEKTRIEARLNESRKYLDNINEGLLLLNPDFTITEEYSSFLKKLFEREDVAGISFPEFIFGNGTGAEEQRTEAEMFLDFMFNNKTAALSMIMELNPLKDFHMTLGSGREIIINGDFMRIYEGEEVRNVMVLFQDLTDIVAAREALESEKELRESELEQIAAILQHGPKVFEEFLLSAEMTFSLLDNNRERLNDESALAEAFRETHSLKGTARYLKFRRLEVLAHRLENHFAALRNGEEPSQTAAGFDQLLDELKSEVDSVRNIIDRFRKFSIVGEGADSEFELFKSRLLDMTAELAEETDKSVELTVATDLDPVPGLQQLQPAIFHLIRNAVDHGIEDSLERVAAQKNETAELFLSFGIKNDGLTVEIRDDGRGIDFETVGRRAVERGFLSGTGHSRGEILKVLFKSGFSSRDLTTEVSGRGVGLDAVQADIHRLGGRIRVKTKSKEGTSFILEIPLKSLEEI